MCFGGLTHAFCMNGNRVTLHLYWSATGAIAPTVARHIAGLKEYPVVNIFQGGKHTQNSHILLCPKSKSTSWHVAGQCLATKDIDLRNMLAGD
ncbi:hypothetical protein CAP48_18235 [Advenella sp. S44]|nr:hypothetical protein CAP48_18235 [Advenella sp. S44]